MREFGNDAALCAGCTLDRGICVFWPCLTPWAVLYRCREKEMRLCFLLKRPVLFSRLGAFFVCGCGHAFCSLRYLCYSKGFLWVGKGLPCWWAFLVKARTICPQHIFQPCHTHTHVNWFNGTSCVIVVVRRPARKKSVHHLMSEKNCVRLLTTKNQFPSLAKSIKQIQIGCTCASETARILSYLCKELKAVAPDSGRTSFAGIEIIKQATPYFADICVARRTAHRFSTAAAAKTPCVYFLPVHHTRNNTQPSRLMKTRWYNAMGWKRVGNSSLSIKNPNWKILFWKRRKKVIYFNCDVVTFWMSRVRASLESDLHASRPPKADHIDEARDDE